MARQTTIGKLSEAKVRSAKGKERPYKLSDGGGLFLLVNPSRSKYWRLKYRLHGKEKTLALGVYPDTTTIEAREAAKTAKQQIRQGTDPVHARKRAKAIKAGNTFRVVAEEWFVQQKGGWSEEHGNRVWKSLEVDVFSRIGDIPIQDIRTLDCLDVVRAVEARGALDVASRIKQRMSDVFRYAIHTARLEINPADQLKGVIATRKVTHRASLKAEALPRFLKQLEDYPGHVLTKLAIKLLILTFVRPGELRNARWAEFNFDTNQWRIPAERMKMNDEHIVPLSNHAIDVLKELKSLTGRYTLVFPGARNARKPMSENTISFAIQKRLGFKATAHGMRSTASTILNEAGFQPDVIERQLAHLERNKVRAAYHHSQYLEKRTEMMQWWADYLDKLKTGAKVMPIQTNA